MQKTPDTQPVSQFSSPSTDVSRLDLPEASLQIVQANDVLKEDWLNRSMLEPKLALNPDGLWVLSIRRQGEHRKFEVPFIGTEILIASAELGLIVVLVGYHGSTTEKYGRLGYLTQKGQFYRYYRRFPGEDWRQVEWRILPDELRQFVLNTVEEQGPAWAKKPGKLQSEHKPPTKRVALTSYKVVRCVSGRYFSLYDPTREYILEQRMQERARPKHRGGFYSYPTLEMGVEFLADCAECVPFRRDVETTQVALLECEIGGTNHRLWAQTLFHVPVSYPCPGSASSGIVNESGAAVHMNCSTNFHRPRQTSRAVVRAPGWPTSIPCENL